jgi:hypothetical protein
MFLGDAELTAGPRSVTYVAEAMILNPRTPVFTRFVMRLTDAWMDLGPCGRQVSEHHHRIMVRF